MLDKVDYTPVPTIVDALLEEGLSPSADRVRARLGRGSNETIGKLIKMRLRELGRLPEEDQEENTRQPLPVAADNAPIPDLVAVALALKTLRLETAIMRATAEAEAFRRVQSEPTEPPTPDQGAWAASGASFLTTEEDGDGFDPAAK